MASLSLWTALLLLALITPDILGYRSNYRRRRRCTGTGQECSMGSTCCNSEEHCVTLIGLDEDGMEIRDMVCRNLRKETAGHPPAKLSGEPCFDSRQCVDLCCREYRMARYLPYRECGPKFDGFINHPCILRG